MKKHLAVLLTRNNFNKSLFKQKSPLVFQFYLYRRFIFLFTCLIYSKAFFSQSISEFKEGNIFTFSTDNQYWLQVQDEQGFLWGFNEAFEIVRFDGMEYHVFESGSGDSTKTEGLSPSQSRISKDERGGIWIVNHSSINRFDLDQGHFDHFNQKIFETDSIGAEGYYSLFEDSRGKFWIGGQRKMYALSTEKDRIEVVNGSNNIWFIFEDEDQDIWYWSGESVKSSKLIQLNPDSFTQKSVVKFPALNVKPGELIMSSRGNFAIPIPGESSEFLILNGGRFFLFNTKTEKIERLSRGLGKEERGYSAYWEGETLLIGTNQNRIIEYHSASRSFSSFLSLEKDQNEEVPVLKIFKSREGILWIVTEKKTYHVLPARSPFHLKPYPDNLHIQLAFAHQEMLLSFLGEVFFHTTEGLVPVLQKPGSKTIPIDLKPTDFFVPKQYLSEQMPPQNEISDLSGIRFEEDKNTQSLWLLLTQNPYGIKLFQYDSLGNKIAQYQCYEEKNCIKSTYLELMASKKGDFWMAGWKGVSRFSPKDQSFKNFLYQSGRNPRLNNRNTLCILEDSHHDIWVGYTKRGVSRIDSSTESITHYRHHPKDLETIISDQWVIDLIEDQNGNIWVASFDGLSRWNRDHDQFTRFSKVDGLPPDNITALLEDQKGQIWVITEGQVSLFDPKANRFYNYGKEDGIEYTASHYNQIFMDNAGNVFHPTKHGAFHFNSNQVLPDSLVPPLVLIEFLAKHKNLKSATDPGLKKSFFPTNSVVELPFDQNDFTIRYAALEYLFPEKIKFAYQLLGYDEEWQEVGAKREATYTNLSPGTYQFKLKCYNRHGFESQEPLVLSIEILPPWYRTILAWGIWIFLLAGGMYALFNYLLKRQLRQAEESRQIELNALKTRLFTNITHEFRTPLTIINGYAKQLERGVNFEQREKLGIVRRNVQQLLRLVNQMLDLSKLESGNMQVNWVQGDIIPILKYLFESFHSLASEKNQLLEFSSSISTLEMDYDPGKLQHIVSNLVSNAIKFTPENGEIKLHISSENEKLKLEFSDTGIGIPKAQLAHVFERFYQVDSSATRKGEGTGIGLTLTKELVHLLNGTIEVKSQPSEGTIFTLRLPITQNAKSSALELSPVSIPKTPQIPKNLQQPSPKGIHNDKPILLLVEDNPDLLQYLITMLQPLYQILTAPNGQKGLELAKKEMPDLIISDVMMPVMDGYELCRLLKEDLHTCHIPIILLTAKADVDSKIEGIEQGADAYLSKPFDEKELKTRLRKLLEAKQKLQQHYTSQDFIIKKAANTQIPHSKLDSQFLQAFQKTIEERIDDIQLSAEQLAALHHLSYNTCFRKIKALTGMGVKTYIQHIRIHKAAEWLQKFPEKTVSEIAHEAGFNSLHFFSRQFKKVIGKSPSAYRKLERS